MSSSIQYRPEVDGLRTIAVIPVILFHINHDWVSGGYVGVDVFFAISGFLITSILLKEVNENRFSITDFYERRIRRLLPLAIVVYIAVIAFFMFIFPPEQFRLTASSVLSSLFFVSNIYFWQLGGYFGPSLETNPVLHTWSLSVEEQFYFFFPVFLYFLHKASASRWLITTSFIVLIGISLSLAIAFAPSPLSFAGFYLLPVRVYELLLGALAALLISNRKEGRRTEKATGLSEIGLIFITIAMFCFDNTMAFPSYFALLPVIGSVFIFVDPAITSPAKRLLASRPLVFCGLISYSLYLWHWPIVVAVKWLELGVDTYVGPLLTIVLTFLLSVFSYNFIETPFRNKKRYPRKFIYHSTMSLMLIIGGMTSALIYTGNSAIVDPDGEIEKLYEEAVREEFNRGKCTNKMREDLVYSSCFLGEKNPQNANILIWGDSHGSAMIPAFVKAVDHFNIEYVNNTGCPPILSVDREGSVHKCSQLNRLVFDYIRTSRFDSIIFIGAFNNYLNWKILIDSQDSAKIDEPDEFAQYLNKTLEELSPFVGQFIFLPQIPRFPYSVPEQVTRDKILNRELDFYSISQDKYEAQSRDIRSILQQHEDISVIDLTTSFCDGVRCNANNKSYLYYKDSHHISNRKAEEIATRIAEQLMEIANTHQ